MRKILLFAIIGLTFNVMAQKPHKATGDKPLYSKEYFFENGDSTLYTRTDYTYNSSKQIIKEISDHTYYKDSTIKTYDAKGRIVSVNQFSDDILMYSESWIYDEINFRIEQEVSYSNEENISFEISTRTIYYGVKDMDATQESYYFASMMGNLPFRDCDSIYVNSYDTTSQTWNAISKIYPIYQNGNLKQATVIADMSSFEDMFGEEMPFTEMKLDLKFTYQGDKLTTVKGSTSIDLGMGIPVPLNNFMTITNQYSGNLLMGTEMVVDINIALLGGSLFYMGMKEVYLYNNEENIICAANYSSEKADIWNLTSKIWYYYGNETLSIGNSTYSGLSLDQNFPNPVTDKAIVNYSIPQDGEINFNIFSINGQLLYNKKENVSFGEHQIELNLSDYASGIYFYTMEYKGQRITKRMSIKR